MILTDREIQIALSSEQILIDPPPGIEAFSSTTVDLTLDSRITVFKEDLADSAIERTIDPSHQSFNAERTIAEITEPLKIENEGYVLGPQTLILGWTAERVELPIHSRLAARVEGKSSLARLGLGVHITAPTVHCGFKNRIRLEIVNHGKVPIRLRAGMRICQLVFEHTFGTPEKGFEPGRTAIASPPLGS